MSHDYRMNDITPEDMNHIIDDMGNCIGNGKYSKTYALNSDPTTAVKEIDFDDVVNCNKETVVTNLRRLTLLSHPNIVNYRWSCLTTHCAYLGMDLYNTNIKNMSKRLGKGGKLFESQVCRMICDVANALNYLHSGESVGKDGVTKIPKSIHGNLHLENILFDEKTGMFAITVLDLEFRNMSDRLKVGSLVYMSPERLLGRKYDTPADIWSLGMISYTLLTGKPLIDSDSVIAQTFNDNWNPNLDAITNEALRCLIKRMLVLDPNDRISAPEIIESISPIILEHNQLCQDSMLNNFDDGKILLQSSQLIQSSINNCNSICLNDSQISNNIASPQANIIHRLDNPIDNSLCFHVEESRVEAISYNQQNCSSNIIDATIMGDIDAVKKIIGSGINLSTRTALGKTPLMCAIESGHEDIAMLLIDHYKGMQDNYKVTALMYAAKNNMLDVAKLLISCEAGEQDDMGWSALMYAVDNGNLEMVQLLVDSEYILKSNTGRAAVAYANARQYENIVEYLSNYTICTR